MIKKVLFVTRFLSGGGAERVVSVLANSMVKMDIEVGVLQFLETDEDYVLDTKVHRFQIGGNYNENSGSKIGRTFSRFRAIRKTIQEFAPDVVIPFLETVVREVYFASRGVGIPIVGTVRNKLVYQTPIHKWVSDQIYGHCDAVFFQTQSQMKFFKKNALKHSFVVPNPINDIFLKKGKMRNYALDIRKIVTAGRLTEQKNHALLIQAMKTVHEKHPECELRIYGEGNDHTCLEKLISKLNLQNCVSLCGRTSMLADIYANSHLFVLSSNYEGMPNALAEAMAAGMPCVSTDCDTGPRELLGNDRGKLTSVDNAEELAYNICWMIEHPIDASRMGKIAYEYTSEHFSGERIAGQLLAECEKTLDL